MNVDNKVPKVKNTDNNSITREQASLTSSPTLANNPDKLKVSFWVHWKDESFIEEIDALKESIQNTANLQEKPYHCPSGFQWNLHRTGTRLFNFRLTAGDLALLLNKRSSEDNIPNMSFEIGSESCWIPGFKEIFQRFCRWIEVLGGVIIKNQVSEVHLAADLIGTYIESLGINDKDRWITRSQLFTTYDTFRQLATVSVGKGDIMLRIYDKILELKRSAPKQATFAEVWGVPHYAAKPVTRVEFQLRRPILKDIKASEDAETGIDTFDDLCDSFQSIWKHCTSLWARHCSEKVDYQNNHQSRATNSEFWDIVTSIIWEGTSIKAKQIARPKKDYKALRKQYIGIGMTLAAFHDVYSDDLDHIISIGKSIFEEDIMSFYRDDEAEFVRRLDKKKREVYETVSTLHNHKTEHPSLHLDPYEEIYA